MLEAKYINLFIYWDLLSQLLAAPHKDFLNFWELLFKHLSYSSVFNVKDSFNLVEILKKFHPKSDHINYKVISLDRIFLFINTPVPLASEYIKSHFTQLNTNIDIKFVIKVIEFITIPLSPVIANILCVYDCKFGLQRVSVSAGFDW